MSLVKPSKKLSISISKRIGWSLIFIFSVLMFLLASNYLSLNPDTFFPFQKETYSVHIIGLMLHITGAMLAIITGPFQFLPQLRKGRFLKLHRWLGRLYLLGIAVGGLAGLYMSFIAFGGIIARLGFATISTLWLFTGYKAYSSIRQKNIDAHKAWMIRNFSLTFAAVTLRIWGGVFQLLGLDFELGYVITAWLSWIPNLLFAEWLIRRGSSPYRSIDKST